MGINFDLDTVWENIIIQIGQIQISSGNALDEQIELDEKKAKVQKEIARLEKAARAERQPKKKFNLVQKVMELKRSLNNS